MNISGSYDIKNLELNKCVLQDWYYAAITPIYKYHQLGQAALE